MKRRISAVLLALGLSVSAFSMGVYAAETELVTEAAQDEAGAAQDALDEGESELEESLETETAETASQEDQIKEYLSSTLTQVSSWSDEEIDAIIDGTDSSSAAIAYNWKGVKDELGAFVEVISAELSEDGSAITGHARYEKVGDNTDVVVTYSVDQTAGTFNVEWEVNYPLSVNIARAGMNTVMGLVIVFVVLFFLSWLIGRLHIIPDMVEKKSKKNQPAPAPTPAPAAVPAAQAPAEEELTDDLELVAVITAAIAASENTSGDGFVVRSIKKSNKRNWQRA